MKNLSRYLILFVFLCAFATSSLFAFPRDRKEVHYYEKSLKYDPYNVQVMERLGHLYLLDGDLDKALDVLLRAVTIDPTNTQARLLLGRVYYWQGRFKEADAEGYEVLLLDPSNAEALVLRGQSAEAVYDNKNARLFYERALKVDPNSLLAKVGLQEVQEREWKIAEPGDYAKARAFDISNEHQKAINLYCHLLVVDPQNANYSYELGEIYVEEMDWRRGEKYIKNAIGLDPDNPRYRLGLFRLYYMEGDFDQAEKEIEALIDDEGRDPQYLLSAGYLALAQGENDRAEEYFEEATSYKPRNEEARRELSQLRHWEGRDIYEFEDERAERFRREGKEDAAIYVYRSLLKKEPKNVEYHFQLGNIYARKRNWVDAENEYREALRLRSDHEDVGVALAYAYIRQKRYEEARRELTWVLDESPTNTDALVAMGQLAYRQQDYDVARGYFETAQEVDKAQQDAYMGLLQLNRLGMNVNIGAKGKPFQSARAFELESRFSDAEKIYLEMLKTDPCDPEVTYRLGRLYSWIDEFSKSEYYLQLTMDLRPKDLDAQTAYAYLLYRMQDFDAAAEEINRVLKESPDNIDALVAGGLIENARNNEKIAKRRFKEVLFLEPEMPEALIGLGRIADRYGQYKKAFDYYQRAYFQNPYNYAAYDGVYNNRPYVNPTVFTKGIYSQERENDLISKERSVQMNTTFGSLGVLMPVSDHFRTYTNFDYLGTEQVNLIQKIDNYMVNSYFWIFGGEVFFKRYWTAKVQNAIKWSHTSALTLLPFEQKTSWEPLISLRFSSEYFFASSAAYMDSFIGRNFQNVRSFNIERKNIVMSLGGRYYPPLGSYGVVGRHSNYNDSFNNHEDDIEIWFQTPGLPMFGVWYFRYAWNWGSYAKVNPDYSSYRYRARHNLSGFFVLTRDPGYDLELSYTWRWVKERDFSNEATTTADLILGQPATLKKNIYNGHIIKALLRKSFATHLFVELSTFYYTDSNKYRTWMGQGEIRYLWGLIG